MLYTDLFRPTYLKNLCQKYGLVPSKQYGQHYLISDAPIKKMLAAAEVSAHDIVVEIGPGFGVLTLALAECAQQVLAFEIEKKLQPYWAERQQEYSNVDVVWGNALRTMDYGQWTMDNGRSSIVYRPYKVLANLPYQITSQILRVLLELEHKPQSITVMVQKEVAERMCATAGEMSLLSVAVQYYGRPRTIARVPRGNFWPQPKVDSAIVHIDIPPHDHTATVQVNDEQFFDYVKAGFSHKRKQLWRNISDGLHLPPEKVKDAVHSVMGKDTVRAEELGVEDWKKLVQRLSLDHLSTFMHALVSFF